MNLSLPLQLLLTIIFVLLFGNFIPLVLIKGIYTFSMLFKEVLIFILPFMIFSFVLNGILSLKKNAPLVLLIMITTIFLSNILVATSMYAVLHFLLPFISEGAHEFASHTLTNSTALDPSFSLNLPPLVRSEYALILAIILGIIFSFYQSHIVERSVLRLKRYIELFLFKCFIPILPLYVLGFMLKLHHENILSHLMKHYGSAFFIIVGVQITYLLAYYAVACGFSFKKTRTAIINAMPSYLTAFGTMSSTLTVPISIEGAVKNTESRPLANIAMPIMANIHLLGDCIGTPILAMVTMQLFFGHLPHFSQYFIFVFYFCTTMFAVSGVPGGGILVMIPILVSILGFTPTMISIITTLYFLLDSFGTAANVMGDGALVIIVNRLVRRFL